MNLLQAMNAFVEVASEGSYAAAARSLNVSTTTVSRLVIELETWLGTTLFRRTTRSLSLTEEGRLALEKCGQLIADIESMRQITTEAQKEPAGLLRVTAPIFLAKECFQKVLPGFLKSYPLIKIELEVYDRVVNVIEEGFDLALRVGNLPDSSLIAKGLGEFKLIIVGSPDYLSVRGVPENAADLRKHNCIVDTVANFQSRWPVIKGGKQHTVSVPGNIRVNNGEIARDLARGGLGLAILPEFFVSPHIRSGELVEVLEGVVDRKVGFYIVYPEARFLAPKTRAFIDYTAAYFREQATV